MTGTTLALVALTGLGSLAFLLERRRRVALQREAFVRDYAFPQGLFEQLRKKRPALDLKQCQIVSLALRQFFLAHLKSGRQYVSMPSQAADDLWHEFILHTRNYEAFCRRAFGRFLHHTPAVAVGSSSAAHAGLRRCWWFACKEDSINPRAPTRLPLLFALDAKLGIDDGFHYTLDCHSNPRRLGRGDDGGGATVYCGSDLAASSSDDSFGGGCGGGSGDPGGDGGGCGGGGCGGGD